MASESTPSSSTTNESTIMKTCAVCKKPSESMSHCGQCSSILYCSRECQKADWRIHKIICKSFAETPCPDQADSSSLRRIILFHPQKTAPEIHWVRPKPGWAVSLLRTVTDRPQPIINRDVHDFIGLVRLPHEPVADHHTAILVRDGFLHDGSVPNLALSTSMRSARLPIAARTGFKGPIIAARHEGKDAWGEFLIPGGPKVLNVTMEDFRDTISWITKHMGLDDSTVADTHLNQLAARRLNPGMHQSLMEQAAAVFGPAIFNDRSHPPDEAEFCALVRERLQEIWEEKQRADGNATRDAT